MRKGLTQTLLTVAVALLGFNAMSAAPVIQSIPDVIIGDAEGGTSANQFVYQDAIDLDAIVADDSTSDSAILWSYQPSGTNYKLNNAAYIGAGDPNAPGAASLTASTDPADTNTARTVTFRNVTHTPISGAASAPTTSETETITLFASDSTTYSQKDFMVYTDNDGYDHLSGNSAYQGSVYAKDFTTGAQGWVSYTDLAIGGTVSTLQNSGGICVDVSAAGVNIAGWKSQADATLGNPYTTVDLTDNSVYQVRVGVSATGTTAVNVPQWSLANRQAVDGYIGDTLWLSNYGFANAPSPFNSTGSELPLADQGFYEAWVTPAGIQTTQFQTNFLNGGTNDIENGFRIELRVLDIDGAGYNAEADLGRICWSGITINRYDIDALTVESTVYNMTGFSAAAANETTDAINGKYTVADYVANSTVSYTGGNISISPSGSGWQAAESAGGGAYVTIRPGDGVRGDGTGAETIDNFPIAWETNVLYKLSYTLASVGTGTPDFIMLGMDAYSDEYIVTSIITNMYNGLAMPNSTAQDFLVFAYSHSKSAATEAEGARLRPRLDLGCNDEFIQTQNTGGIVLSRVKVDKVSGRQ